MAAPQPPELAPLFANPLGGVPLQTFNNGAQSLPTADDWQVHLDPGTGHPYTEYDLGSICQALDEETARLTYINEAVGHRRENLLNIGLALQTERRRYRRERGCGRFYRKISEWKNKFFDAIHLHVETRAAWGWWFGLLRWRVDKFCYEVLWLMFYNKLYMNIKWGWTMFQDVLDWGLPEGQHRCWNPLWYRFCCMRWP